ncbi:hypothetical protein GEMRC1_007336 [Eukaryota sp. GEM-RC1]
MNNSFSHVSEYFTDDGHLSGILLSPVTPTASRKTGPSLSRSLLDHSIEAPRQSVIQSPDVSRIVSLYEQALDFYSSLLVRSHLFSWIRAHEASSRDSVYQLSAAYNLYISHLLRKSLAAFSYNRKRNVLRKTGRYLFAHRLTRFSFLSWRRSFLALTLGRRLLLIPSLDQWRGALATALAQRRSQERQNQSIVALNFYAELIKRRYFTQYLNSLNLVRKCQSADYWFQTRLSAKYFLALVLHKDHCRTLRQLLNNSENFKFVHYSRPCFSSWLRLTRFILLSRKTNDIINRDFLSFYFNQFTNNAAASRNVSLVYHLHIGEKVKQQISHYFQIWTANTDSVLQTRVILRNYLDRSRKFKLTNSFGHWFSLPMNVTTKEESLLYFWPEETLFL